MAKIAISGSTGFLGAALGRALRARGDEVLPLVRPRGAGAGIRWDPERGEIDRAALEGVDAVVHLAGESIAGGRWSAAQKQRIEHSRTRGTALVCDALCSLRQKPQVWLSASAIGIYGDRGSAPLDEGAPAGSDFLAHVCLAWEAAAAPARQAGIRLAHPRFGLVLDPSGGALAKMLPAFRWGVGGALGDGTQIMSWVALPDAVRALLFALDQPTFAGPFNVTAPEPVTNAEFTRVLARVLKRPGFMNVPRFALRAALGEMADGALLSSANALPRKLTEAGFRFDYAALETYLRSVL